MLSKSPKKKYQYYPFAQSNEERIIPIQAAFTAAVTVNLDYRPNKGFHTQLKMTQMF